MTKEELRREVRARIATEVGECDEASGAGTIFSVNCWMVNIRVATDKHREGYFFDFTPGHFHKVDFAVFACGYPDCLYVIPVLDLWRLTANASLGGAKQVPNFTLFPAVNEFEPAGQAERRLSILKYFDDLEQLTLA